MRARVGVLLFAIAMLAAACGGGDEASAPTEGAGATRETDIARFTTAVKGRGADGRISINGVSCDGLPGPYLVTVAVRGNLSGKTIATLPIHAGSTAGTLKWSMEVTGAEAGTMSGHYHAKMSGLVDPSTLVLRGRTTIHDASGTRTFMVEARDIQIEADTGPCPNP